MMIMAQSGELVKPLGGPICLQSRSALDTRRRLRAQLNVPKLAYRTTLPKPDDPEILDAIASDVARGVALRFAAVAAGISEDTAYQWMQQGAQELAAFETDGVELGSRALFAKTVKEAQAACVQDCVTRWRSAAPNDWQRWPTLAERVFPAEYGKRTYQEVDQRTLSVNVTAQLDPAQAEALLRMLSRSGESPLAGVKSTLPEALMLPPGGGASEPAAHDALPPSPAQP